jgi:hypothetical protein
VLSHYRQKRQNEVVFCREKELRSKIIHIYIYIYIYITGHTTTILEAHILEKRTLTICFKSTFLSSVA